MWTCCSHANTCANLGQVCRTEGKYTAGSRCKRIGFGATEKLRGILLDEAGNKLTHISSGQGAARIKSRLYGRTMRPLIQFLLLVLGHLPHHPSSCEAAVSLLLCRRQTKTWRIGTMSAIIQPKPVIEAHCFLQKYLHSRTFTHLTHQMQCILNRSIKQSIIRWGTRTKDRFESSKMATKSRTDTRCLTFRWSCPNFGFLLDETRDFALLQTTPIVVQG